MRRSTLNIRSIEQVALTVGVALVMSLQPGCQKQNIKVKGHDLGTILAADKQNAKGTPVDLPGALEAARNFIQTRGVITLKIDSSKVSPSSPLELVNTTTGFSLIKTAAGAFGLDDVSSADEPSWGLTSNGYDFTLTIYPLDPSFDGKFSYGENKLLLNVNEAASLKDAKEQVTMQDFDYFSRAYASFGNNEEQQEGYQGEVSKVTGIFVSNGDYELSTGFVGVVNR